MQLPTSHEDTRNEYADALQFISTHGPMSYRQFDDCVVKDLRLFDIPKDDYFAAIEGTLDEIIKALPAMKRILARPLIRLKDTEEIVPIEAVRIINNHTLSHASLHSEMWGDVTSEGIKPKKLLTVEKTETYVLYENIVFSRVVDAVLRYVKRTAFLLKDVLYGCQDLHFNLLDRTHHSAYFLAVGKLHIEYARAQDNESRGYARCVEKMLFIDKTLRAKLNAPVYVQCKKKKQKITLKKTNAFRSHKDYKQIYQLLGHMESDVDLSGTATVGSDEGVEHDDYRAFCILLSTFAVGHFNFEFAPNQLLDFANFKARATFGKWKLSMKAVKNRKVDGLCFTFKKDVDYTVCLVFCEKHEITVRGFEAFKKTAKADEYWFASPKAYGESDVMYLSLYDVDSFRRIQQMLLRGMIYSDRTYDTCPFCGHAMQAVGDGWTCDVCRGEITTAVCPETGESYFLSGIRQLRSVASQSAKREEKSKFLHDRYAEAQFHFRNITPITSDGIPVCPKCGKVHAGEDE